MPYTLGAVHSGLVNTGSIAIATPIGLKLHLAGVPAYIGRDDSTPATLYRVGSLTPGNADGYGRRILLDHVDQLVLPLQPESTVLAYDLVAAATMTVQELVAVPTPPTLPFDRSPVLVSLAFADAIGAHSSPITRLSYTVPAGRMLMITSADLRMHRQTVASALGANQLYMLVSGSPVLRIDEDSNTLQVEKVASLSPAGALVLPGGTVIVNTICAETGGQHFASANIAGYTFTIV